MTRRAELAVRAVAVLAGDPPRRKSGDLAEHLGTTPGFVAQVVNPLVKAGWVRSEPGPSGGYTLREGARSLSVLQVIEAVDGLTDDGQCVVSDRRCDGHDECVLHRAWMRARRELLTTLGGMSAVDSAVHRPRTRERDEAADAGNTEDD